MKLWSILLLMAVSMPLLMSCGSDDENNGNSNTIGEYVGKWSCSSPSYRNSTIVEKGTILLITASGDMTWTMAVGNKYTATMRALGDDWADINYNGKTYRAEIYVNNNSLTINVNGNVDLKVKDFPFDGSYKRVN